MKGGSNMNTIGIFRWEKGSINDNIRKILIDKGIKYQNTFNGNIEVDLLGIGLWQKVQHTLTNPDNETYAVYVN